VRIMPPSNFQAWYSQQAQKQQIPTSPQAA
jgi:hypothetical protein